MPHRGVRDIVTTSLDLHTQTSEARNRLLLAETSSVTCAVNVSQAILVRQFKLPWSHSLGLRALRDNGAGLT